MPTSLPASKLRVLIVEPDASRRQALERAISELGGDAVVLVEAKDAPRICAELDPTHAFISLSRLRGQVPDGPSLLQFLQDEGLLDSLRLFFTCADDELVSRNAHKPEAYLIWPIATDTLKHLCSRPRAATDDEDQQAARLRSLYGLSLLGPELIREIDQLARSAALGFEVDKCILWGPEDESHWPRSNAKILSKNWPAVRNSCELAIIGGRSVILSADTNSAHALHDGHAQTLLAASIGPEGEPPLAGLCIQNSRCQIFSQQAIDSLEIVARRLSKEMAWMSAHHRLLDEHESLRKRAFIDPMLGVWNRPALQEAIDKQIASDRERSQSLAVLMLDYRKLRNVNDRYGHLVGDAVLTHFAQVVKSCLRSRDLLGRVGGDELVVFLVESTLADAESLANTILETLSRHHYVNGELSVEHVAQVGVTAIGSEEISSDAAFVRAQMAIDTGKLERDSVVVVETNSESLYVNRNPSLGSLLSSGSTLGGIYRIIHEISRGSMGVVYRGEDLGLGRPVAIKLLRADLSSDKALVAKFRSEAALLASLHHRNVVQVYSFGTEGDAVYFVMELVEGEPLSNIVESLARQGVYIDVAAVAKIVEEIAEALDAIHALGIVHRDVKPDNVLVDRINDRAVLVDVGIAKRQGDARDAAGTPGFAAPESFMEADESPATDVYGLAATAYAILTGSAPYKSDALAIMVGKQLTTPPPPPTQFRPDLSSAVDSVLSTALAPNPVNRYRSANAFSIALSRALAKQPSRAAAQSSASNSPASTAVRTKMGSGALGQLKNATTTSIDLPLPQAIRGANVSNSSTYRVSAPITDERADVESGRSRGVIFRVTRQFVEQKLGRDWYQDMLKDEPLVGKLLMPNIPPDSWQLTSRLLRLLRRMQHSPACSPAMFQRLGSRITASTLAQAYGADPKSQSPSALLKAAESYWRRYHTWGRLSVEVVDPRLVRIELHEGPANEMFCQVLSGMFSGISTLAGASQPQCQVVSCQGRGDVSCSFVVQWAESVSK